MDLSTAPPPPTAGAIPLHGARIDRDLIARMASHGPRYTSYPTADHFHDGFGEAHYRAQAAAAFPAGERRALSLYVHVPFCDTICHYCGCNKVVTANKARAAVYLDYLDKEIALQAPLFHGRARIEQMHIGGGTPTFLSDGQLAALMASLRRHLALVPVGEGEFSIEIDPRKVGPETVARLAALGFNRMSLGVQDLDPAVQVAVNRVQSETQTRTVMTAARAHGFRSLSLDLIYGLPRQTVETFARTLERVVDMRPDRLSVYHYAHLPHLFKSQRRIREDELPSPAAKLDILALAIERLREAGYVYIGMDHFALPDDELAQAQRDGTLQRNFQGYSTRADVDLLALGVSGIGRIGDSYSQNVRDTDSYYALLDQGRLPLLRGLALTDDDRLRRAMIQRIMCRFALDTRAVEADWNIDFDDYFAPERTALAALERDGLVRLDAGMLRVLPRGRLLVRNIAMVFDARLRQRTDAMPRHSRTV